MTLVMDGVRRVTAAGGMSAAVIATPNARSERKPAPKRINAHSSRANSGVRYVTGMDGIRRPAYITPREVIANIQGPAPRAAFATAAPRDEIWMEPTPVWQLPSLRLPEIEWKRPALAFALIASVLLVAGLGVRFLVTPRTNAPRAEAASGSQATAPAPAKAAAVSSVQKKTGLQQILTDFVAANPDKWGIVVKDLKTGETATYQADKQMESASLYKLFVAQRIYQQIDLGQLDYGRAAGGDSGLNIDGCLTIMINISDNSCGRALGDILQWGAQNQALTMEGYKQTDLASPQQTSAGDVAELLTRLYNGTLVSADSSQRFLGLLKDQKVNNRLPVGLPTGTEVAHKTGDLDGYVHDVGIVYGPKTDYLIVAMSGSWDSPGNAPAMFSDLSTKMWNYFEQ